MSDVECPAPCRTALCGPSAAAATSGSPGVWGAGAVPIAADVFSGHHEITPSPGGAWSLNSYIVTADNQRIRWNGTKWVMIVPATGATAGAPGSWTPAGSSPPATFAALDADLPNAVVPSPNTAWTTGQYVQTATAGAPGQGYWDGTDWVAGTAP